ncbi:hypothetical protein NDU88_001147 [Pleurodeles waltl]|uniref:Uncharacterized protein n=1 Tax=Pleurodeles waltl TaxID=8319 RepID=A0AAV7RC49_PLEWA|nr:hypothetical protein NDU88_001147 [Pleurodeles waltl]
MPTGHLPADALQDEAFPTTLVEHIASYFTEDEGPASDAGTEWDAFKVVLRGHANKTTYDAKTVLRKELHTLKVDIHGYEQSMLNVCTLTQMWDGHV